MTNDEIRKLAMGFGFTCRIQGDGTFDLNPYVYEFARALIASEQALFDGWRDAVAFYVHDHCVDGETHAEAIRAMGEHREGSCS